MVLLGRLLPFRSPLILCLYQGFLTLVLEAAGGVGCHSYAQFTLSTGDGDKIAVLGHMQRLGGILCVTLTYLL